MSDLERLTEALATYSRKVRFQSPSMSGAQALAPMAMTGDERQQIESVEAAARAYRDVLANGERVWWCEEHNGQGVPNLGRDPERCWKTAMKHVDPGHCRIVSKLLVDPTTEEER